MRVRGFTLIEAMVALTIFAMLVMFGMPSVADFIRNQRIRTAAESIQSGLLRARSEAVRRNTSVGFWLVSLSDPTTLDNSCALSATSGSWVISGSSPEGSCGADASTSVAPMLVAGRPVGNAGSAITVSATESDGSTAATGVTFNGLGQVSNSDAISHIAVSSASVADHYRRLRVDVSAGGDVRVCDLDVTDSADPRYCTP